MLPSHFIVALLLLGNTVYASNAALVVSRRVATRVSPRLPVDLHSGPRDWEMLASTTQLSCPCTNVTLCQPLRTPKPAKELFVYTPNERGYAEYNWSKITTLATYSLPDPQLVCVAHERGVRVVLAVTPKPTDAETPARRSAYAAKVATAVRVNGLDGVNMDYEHRYRDPLVSNFVTAMYYAMADAVRKDNNNAQMSLCFESFTWTTPTPQTYFPYDFAGLVLKSDFLVGMMYTDTGRWKVGPNSLEVAIDKTFEGMLSRASIPPSKLVLALPWYGFEYHCINGTLKGENCRVHLGVPRCNEVIERIIAGQDSCYRHVSQVRRVLTGPRASYSWMTAVNHCDTEAPTRIFMFDDVTTLIPKYRAAMSGGAMGLSMWHAYCLGSSNTEPMLSIRKEMWEVINSFI